MKTLLFAKLPRLPLFNLLSLAVSLFFTVASSLLIIVKAAAFPLAVPLWFSTSWGVGWLAEPIYLWLIPTINLIIILVNFTMARLFPSEERILSFLLVGSSPVISGLLFYTLLRITLVTT
jgi:hypothetical protein